jgi:hypothetical protein
MCQYEQWWNMEHKYDAVGVDVSASRVCLVRSDQSYYVREKLVSYSEHGVKQKRFLLV